MKTIRFTMEELVSSNYKVQVPDEEVEEFMRLLKSDTERSEIMMLNYDYEIETTDYIESYYDTITIN